MSEGNHSNVTSGTETESVTPTTSKKRNLLIPIIAGTTVCVLAAGVIFQVMKAEPAAAVGEKNQQSSQQRTPQSLARVNGQIIS